MKNRLFNIAVVLALLALVSCSTKKNTWSSRTFHYITARYNVNFNAKEALKKGEKAIDKANVDDYNEILPIYTISNHSNAEAASGEMTTVIEKSQKCIKLHSIVKKPKSDPKKRNNPEYKAFLAKEEYNSQVQEAWLLMGKAQFYQLDFAASAATFSYIIAHFSDNFDVCSEARLWLARSYYEQEWFYEAEDVLNKMNDKSFNQNTSKMFVTVKADLLLKEGHLADAVPFLETALENASRKDKARISFVYAQVLERLGRYDEAYEKYDYTIKRSTPYVMEFNSFLGKSRCYKGRDYSEVLADLRHLLKRQSNGDYQDQIYNAIAELYMRNGDEEQAISYYKLSIEKSTRNGIDKAKSLLSLGDIYYGKEEYCEAQPLYKEAVSILPLEYDGYRDISTRSQDLDMLVQNIRTVQLEDSLQALAALPEQERIAKVKKVLEEQAKAEEEERRRLEEEARNQELREQNQAVAQNGLSLGESADKSWYFYNQSLISRGKVDFQKNWGRRVLEDDWRRSNKIISSVDDEPIADEESDEESSDSETVDNTQTDEDSETVARLSGGDARLASALRQIPTTAARKEQSDLMIADALHNMFMVYNDRIENYPKAVETIEELERRFPSYAEVPSDYYRLYRRYIRTNETYFAQQTKNKILSDYGDSKYAALLRNTTVTDGESQDTKAERLYRTTYEAFLSGDASSVNKNSALAQTLYPDSKLIPKFMFLEAIINGRSEGSEMFKERLKRLIDKYPESEITPLARNMVALAGQGNEIQSGSMVSTISAERTAVVVSEEEYADALQKAGFTYDPLGKHLFVILMECDEKQKNDILFSIAGYNFTRFMIKSYDLEVRNYEQGLFALAVSGMDNLDESIWYQDNLLSDLDVRTALKDVNYRAFAISVDNYGKIFDKESSDKYIEFYQSNSLEIKQSEINAVRESTGFVGE